MDPSAFRARMKDVDKCVGCGICEKYCRFDAIEISNGKCIVTQSECYGCGSCVTMCPVDALELYYVGESDDE